MVSIIEQKLAFVLATSAILFSCPLSAKSQGLEIKNEQGDVFMQEESDSKYNSSGLKHKEVTPDYSSLGVPVSSSGKLVPMLMPGTPVLPESNTVQFYNEPGWLFAPAYPGYYPNISPWGYRSWYPYANPYWRYYPSPSITNGYTSGTTTVYGYGIQPTTTSYGGSYSYSRYAPYLLPLATPQPYLYGPAVSLGSGAASVGPFSINWGAYRRGYGRWLSPLW